MKKLFILFISIVLLLGITAHAEGGDISVYIDDQKIEFDVPPMISAGRTLVPLRKIFEELGATVEYHDATQEITAVKEDITVKLTVDSDQMYRNDVLITLDVPATVVNDRTLVPVRAISEAFQCKVQWEEETNSVWIYTPAEAPVIDFSNDTDGAMYAVHGTMRYLFEQQALPQMLQENKDALAQLMVNSPADFIAEIDNGPWTKAMITTLISYLSDAEEEYIINNADELYALLSQKADEFQLHAYQNYEPEALMLGDQYVILLHMADIEQTLISTYIAIVYDEESGFSYYMLETSFGDLYMLCSSDGASHSNYGTVENTRDGFLSAIKELEGKK